MGTPRGRWVLLATVLGSGLAMLDATVVNVALERIGNDLGAGFAGLQWTINGYALTLAALILLGGSLGDRFGRRRVFLVGVVWFAAASMLCALAPDIGTLVAARALQGVGGALLTPGSLAIISSSFHRDDRAAAVGAWAGLGGVAGAVGPFVGGGLVEIGWQLVFLVNVPLAALIVVVTVRHVPESRDPDAVPRLDVPGTVIAVVGLGLLTYGLTAAGDDGFTGLVVPLLVLGAAALVAFVRVEQRSPSPLVPTSLFRDAQFSATNAVTLLAYAALGVLFVLVVLQLQVVADRSPLVAGTAILPVTVIMLLLSPRAGALAQRIGPRLPMAAGLLVAAAGVLWLAAIDAGAAFVADVLLPSAVVGAGLTLMVAPLTATVLASAPERYAGTASGVNNAVARTAGLLAVAVVPAAAGIGGADYTDPDAFSAGYVRGMLICAGLLAAAAVLSAVAVRRPLTVPPPSGRLTGEPGV
ncbi:DHA2 family efflux MFS transporter permease subunit [Nocardioides sp. TF02-7]|uniref:DHA2 family efflux MFS transporter permease subunit n=1 Tax=Nocardioides sp. TF02-7 TaxID=2917724 RepID=UPI001F06B6B5|nr:DHA2 family efflux MFS transporter permease subunit [Nocardioides sp. TF02-7]UMG93379.1 DHA2 family efflux MFS transporter permease subunit [Nocardioides sp. TF02-7]